MASKTPPLTINELFPEQFTKLDCRIIPPSFRRSQFSSPLYKAAQDTLCKVIDTLGEQSAAAQGLNKVITSVERLRAVHNHYLYILKDSEADNGRGEVLAMLKVGYKHLFLFDESGKLRELEPPCVLDFFVIPTHQRQGYGRVLFDYMLNDMDVMLPDLAIDGPSQKMISFLQRNYGIEHLIRQSNNFAIAPGFFDHIESGASKVRTGPPEKPRPSDRCLAYRPISSIGAVIHGGELGESASRHENYEDVPVETWNDDYTEWSPAEDYHDSDSDSDIEPSASGSSNQPDVKYQPSQFW